MAEAKKSPRDVIAEFVKGVAKDALRDPSEKK